MERGLNSDLALGLPDFRSRSLGPHMFDVLILNRDSIAGESLAQKLAAGGHRVVCSLWPHQALRRVRLRNFDLVWMAWPLVGMEGVHFLQRLWSIQPDLPVVAIGREDEVSPELRRQLKVRGIKMILQREPKAPLALAITAVCARQAPPSSSTSA